MFKRETLTAYFKIGVPIDGDQPFIFQEPDIPVLKSDDFVRNRSGF